MEFVSFIDTRKGKKLLNVFKSQRAANMFLKKNMDNILSKSGIESVGSMSKKEWDTKEAKYAIEGFSSDAQRKAAFANGYEEKDKKNEGKKRFKRQDGIGKAKYTVSYHDGKKKHKDGSDFFDIKIFKNKKDLSDFVGTLAKQGYKLTRESVNEGKYDGVLDKIEDLVSKAKSFMDVGNQLKKQKIKYSFSTSMIPMYKLDKLPIAIVNKKYVDKADREVGDIAIGLMESIKESLINEGPSSEELRIVMMAVRKIAKYRNVPINQSITDVLNAAEQLKRDIEKGKIKK